jgi:hypothetical protein
MGGAPPLLLMLISWRLSMTLLSGLYLTEITILGLLLGLITDVIIVPEFVKRAFTLTVFSITTLYATYLFLFWFINITLPWQCIFPGLGAGWFAGRKTFYLGGDRILLKHLARKANTICFIGTLATFGGSIVLAIEGKEISFKWVENLHLHPYTSYGLTGITIVAVAVITLFVQWILIRGFAHISYRYATPTNILT